MEHDLYLIVFGIKKIDNFNPYSVLWAIATNIPVRLMTGLWSRVTYYKNVYRNITFAAYSTKTKS